MWRSTLTAVALVLASPLLQAETCSGNFLARITEQNKPIYDALFAKDPKAAEQIRVQLALYPDGAFQMSVLNQTMSGKFQQKDKKLVLQLDGLTAEEQAAPSPEFLIQDKNCTTLAEASNPQQVYDKVDKPLPKKAIQYPLKSG